MYRIGENPVDFTLNKYGGGSFTLSQATYANKVTLLSFIDINDGWDLLHHIVDIRRRFSAADVQVVAVIFDHTSFVDTSSIDAKFPDPNLTPSDLMNPDMPVCMDTSWITSVAYQYGIGFNNTSDPSFNANAGQALWTYIISENYLITDKWNLNCNANNDPISFKRLFPYFATLSLDISYNDGGNALVELTSGITDSTGLNPLTGTNTISITYSLATSTYTIDLTITDTRIVGIVPIHGSEVKDASRIVVVFSEDMNGADVGGNYTLTLTNATDNSGTGVSASYSAAGFDSTDFDNTERFIKQRLIHLLKEPTILYTLPAKGSAVIIGDLSDVEIAYSKPVSDAPVKDSQNYPVGGGGGSGLTTDPTIYYENTDTGTHPYPLNAGKIENVATLSISGTLNPGTIEINVNNSGAGVTKIADTAGTQLLNNHAGNILQSYHTIAYNGPEISNINPPAAGLHNSLSTVTFTFTDEVYKTAAPLQPLVPLDISNFSITPTGLALTGTPTVATVDNISFDLDFSGVTIDGVGTLEIDAADVMDKYGNALRGTAHFTYNIDTEAPIAVLSNTPSDPTNVADIDVIVGGADVVSYRYRLDGGGWGPETAVSTHIVEAGLSEGLHTLHVIGKDAADNWQLEADATEHGWTVDTQEPTVTVDIPGTAPYTRHHPDIPISLSGSPDTTHWFLKHTLQGDPVPDDPGLVVPDPGDPTAEWIPDAGKPDLYTLPFIDQTYTIYAWAKDGAGNIGRGSVDVTLEMRRDIALVLDYSGSMNSPIPIPGVSGNTPKIDILKQSVEFFLSQLNGMYGDSPNDRSGVVNYSTQAQLVQNLTTYDHFTPANITTLLNNNPPPSATAMGAGLANALHYDDSISHEMLDYTQSNIDYNKLRFIVLFADGQQNIHPYVVPNAGDTAFTIDTNDNGIGSGCPSGMGVITVDNHNIPIHTLGLGYNSSWLDRLLRIASITGATHLENDQIWPNLPPFFETIMGEMYYGSSPQVVARDNGILQPGETKTVPFSLNQSVTRVLLSVLWLGGTALTVTLKKGSRTITNPAKVITSSQYRIVRIDFPHRQFVKGSFYADFLDSIKDKEKVSGHRIIEVLKQAGVDIKALIDLRIPLRELSQAGMVLSALLQAGVKPQDVVKNPEMELEVLVKAGVTKREIIDTVKLLTEAQQAGISAEAIEKTYLLFEALAHGVKIGDLLRNRALPVDIFMRNIHPEGTWCIKIHQMNPDSGNSQIPYYLSVIAEDKAFHYSTDPGSGIVHTGEPIGIGLEFHGRSFLDGNLLRADVRVSYPRTAVGNILAKYGRHLFKRAKDSNEPEANPVDQRLSALYLHEKAGHELRKRGVKRVTLKQVKKKDSKKERTLKGLLWGRYRKAKVAGIYKLEYRIRGIGKDARFFERTCTRTVIVRAKPCPGASFVRKQYDDKDKKMILSVTPRDRYGNLLGPGYDQGITCGFKTGREVIIKDNLDGSYRIETVCNSREEFKRLRPVVRVFDRIIYGKDEWRIS